MATTQEKQKYLYEEIIEAGLDPEQFQGFLEEKRPDTGLDINSWKIQQLRDVVRQFKIKIGVITGPSQQRPQLLIKPQDKTVEKTQKITAQSEKKITQQTKQEVPKVTQQTKPKFGQRIVAVNKKQSIKQQKKVEKIPEQKKKLQTTTSPTLKKDPPKIQQQKPIQKKIITQKPVQKSTIQKIPQKSVNLKRTDQLPQQIPQQTNQLPLQTSQLKQTTSIKNESFYQIDPNNAGQIYFKSVNCIKTQVNNIFNKQIVVEIKNFQRIQGGIFQQAHIIYRVQTRPEKWTVMRRYNDFVWLKQQLQKMHPGIPIPPIAKKGSFRKFDEAHLYRRMVVLENFLNKILNIPKLKCEKIVQNFLKIVDNVEYVKSVRQNQIPENRVNIEKMKNFNGKINLVIDPKIQLFLNTVKDNINVCQPYIHRLYKVAKGVTANLQNIALEFQQISSIFNILSAQTEKFNRFSNIEGKTQSSYLYGLMQATSLTIAKLMQEQGECIKKYLYGVYKYQYINQSAIQDAIKKVDDSRDQYYIFKAKLKKLKEKMYEEKNYSKWGLSTYNYEKIKVKDGIDKTQAIAIMLPKQTEYEQQLKDYYALINNQCYQQINRFYSKNSKHLGFNVEELSKKLSKNSSENLMLWADLMTKAMSFQEGKKMMDIQIHVQKKK